MHFFDKDNLEKLLDYKSLINALQTAFCEEYSVPVRQHYNYENPGEDIDSTLLLMPAWKKGGFLGVKLVTVSPNNSRHKLPSIQGIYTLFDAQSGTPLAQLDAPTLTNLRTAAASALASSYLSRKNADTLLMVGTGSLAPYLIRAHLSVRPIQKVYVWGRNFSKAQHLVKNLRHLKIPVVAVESLQDTISKVSIISCATLSQRPLIKGQYLIAGQHIDLVGSYKPDMREADDETVQRASLFVDTLEGASKESGDLFQPLQNGIIQKRDIKSDLFGICRNGFSRTKDDEITLFKSVGHALEDLAAAELVFKKWNAEKK